MLMLLLAVAGVASCCCDVIPLSCTYGVFLCHILVQGSTELPIIAEMLIHFRFGENEALICP
jgi:hypothetical protein